jgi:hypothetical protein
MGCVAGREKAAAIEAGKAAGKNASEIAKQTGIPRTTVRRRGKVAKSANGENGHPIPDPPAAPVDLLASLPPDQREALERTRAMDAHPGNIALTAEAAQTLNGLSPRIAGYRASETVEKTFFNRPPSVFKLEMMTTETSEAIRPYSIAVTPRRSFRSCVTNWRRTINASMSATRFPKSRLHEKRTRSQSKIV